MFLYVNYSIQKNHSTMQKTNHYQYYIDKFFKSRSIFFQICFAPLVTYATSEVSCPSEISKHRNLHTFSQSSDLLIIHKLLQINAHWGYKKNNSTKSLTGPYLLGFRNGIAIINLEQTMICIQRALNFLKYLIKNKGCLLFINHDPECARIIKKTAEKTGQSCLINKWIGGFFTNHKRIKRTIFQTRKNINTIQQFDCLIIFNANYNATAILEAHRTKVAIISLVDSDTKNYLFNKITYPIPLNSRSFKCVYYICNLIIQTILQTQMELSNKIQT